MHRIKAYFDTMLQARQAVDAVKSIGCKSAYLDMVERMYSEYSSELGMALDKQKVHTRSSKRNTPISEDGISMRIAEIPGSISGIMEVNENLHNFSTYLLVNVESKDISRVKEIIISLGGELQ